MKMLITGGAGFIGSHLCEKYTKEGHTVICLDNFMSGDLMNIRHLLDSRNFKLVKGDIRDFDLLEKVMRDVDVVFHLAAQIHVDRSYIEPKLTYDAKKLIFASTSEVYGSAQYSPIDENHPLNAPHPYGASKLAGDRMCFAYMHTYGMNISIVRLFNTFGPRQRDVGYGGVISIFTRRILKGMPPIIYGDGLQTRDYTYVDDAVRAYDAVLKHSEPIAEPINFGSGREETILDLADMLIDLAGKKEKIRPVHVEPRIGEVKRLIANSARAKDLLGWQPQCKLEEGLEKFVQWYKDYGLEERIGIE